MLLLFVFILSCIGIHISFAPNFSTFAANLNALTAIACCYVGATSISFEPNSFIIHTLSPTQCPCTTFLFSSCSPHSLASIPAISLYFKNVAIQNNLFMSGLPQTSLLRVQSFWSKFLSRLWEYVLISILGVIVIRYNLT